MEKTASDILNEAADLLVEEDRWTKGQYFKRSPNGCAMCAHGLIAYCGDQSIKASADDERSQKLPTPRSIFAIDHSSKEMVLTLYGQLGLAHYYAEKAGLTFAFNDHCTTSKTDVIKKLREAALLASK